MLLNTLKTNMFLHFNSENISLFNIIPIFPIPLVQIDEKFIICITSIIIGALVGYGILNMIKESLDELSRSSRLDNDLLLKLRFKEDEESFHRFKMNIYKAVADTKTVEHLGVSHVVMQRVIENGVSTKKFLGADLVEGVDKILMAEEVPKEMPKDFSMHSLGRLSRVKARLAKLPVDGIYDMFIAGETCGVVILNTDSDLPELSFPAS